MVRKRTIIGASLVVGTVAAVALSRRQQRLSAVEDVTTDVDPIDVDVDAVETQEYEDADQTADDIIDDLDDVDADGPTDEEDDEE